MKGKTFKKILIAGLGVLAAASLFSFGNKQNQVQAAKKSSSSLVIYFSKTGNTERAAKRIQKETGARILRITPKKPYPNDYDETTRVARNQIDRNIHPAIKTKLPSIKRYSHIYIGFPTWWMQPPMIIHTLFDRYNFRGKTITPFTTSAESPISSSMPVMRRLAKNDHAKLTKGYRYTSNSGMHKFLLSIGALKSSKKTKKTVKKSKSRSRKSVKKNNSKKPAKKSAKKSSKKTSKKNSKKSNKKANTNASTSARPTNRKSLVVYFSMSGNTQTAAEQIQKLTNSDIYRIQAADPYPSDYDGYARRGDNERRNNIHPVIRGTIPNWDQYSTIYVGFPTWWQQPPMIIHTLFDQYNFRGKTIVPFTTSMSTPMSASMPYIRQMAQPYNATVLNGYRYTGSNTGLKNWLHSLILIK